MLPDVCMEHTASCPGPGYHWKKPDFIFFALPFQEFMHIAEIPRASSSPGWRMPTTSAFPHRRDASVHSWQYSQLSLNRNQFFQKVYLENDEYWYNINPWIEQTVQMQIKTEKTAIYPQNWVLLTCFTVMSLSQLWFRFIVFYST